ncbi:MAG: Mur ligase domain-containing protein, partial [Planctomycetota bacterium]
MRLSEIIARLGPDAREVCPDGTGGPDPEVTSVVTDSREAAPGAVFCALPGEHADGADFIADAHERGAVAAITERAGVTPLRQLVVPDARAAMRTAAWALWEHDARAMHLAAVTGTNGKTTVVTLLRDMLVAGGASAGLVGTLGRDIGGGL